MNRERAAHASGTGGSEPTASHEGGRFLMRGLLHGFYWCDEGLQRSLRAAGLQSLSRTKSMIMVNLSDGVTRASELARNMGISRQATHQTLSEMEREGWITLVPDPEDGRAKVVRLSHVGAEVGRAAFAAMERMEVELGRRLGLDAVATLKEIVFKDWGPVVDAGSGTTGPDGEGPRHASRKSK